MRVVVVDENVGPWLEADEGLPAEGIEILRTDAARAPAQLRDADAYVGVYFPDDLREAAGERFSFLQVTAAGVDHIDIDALPGRVTVANAYGHERSIAEHVLMVTFALRRRLFAADRALRDGRWSSRLVDPQVPGFSTLRGARVGIVGWGHIAREIAAVVQGLGATVAAVTRTPERATDSELAEWIGGYDDTRRLAAESEVLILACPLVDRTRHLVDDEVLRALGEGGVLVNVARGAVVDDGALYRALVGGEILGAAIDVWDVPAGASPVSQHPLAEAENIIMTPHYSATAVDTYQHRAAQVADNLRRVGRGEAPTTLIRGGER